MSEDLEGSGRSQYQDMIQNLAGETEKTAKTAVMAVCKLVRIRTGKFPKINLRFVSALRRLAVCVHAINAGGGVEA